MTILPASTFRRPLSERRVRLVMASLCIAAGCPEAAKLWLACVVYEAATRERRRWE